MKSRFLLLSILTIILFSNLSFTQNYYVTESGTKFHYNSCRFVAITSKSIELKEAIVKDYEPCGVCKPGGEALANDFYNWKAEQDSLQNVNGEVKKIEKKRCIAKTHKGTQCKRNAEEKSKYCWQHRK